MTAAQDRPEPSKFGGFVFLVIGATGIGLYAATDLHVVLAFSVVVLGLFLWGLVEWCVWEVRRG